MIDLEQIVEAAVARAVAPLVAEVRALRAEREHAAGRWGSRAEYARHRSIGLDAVDGMISRGELRVERIGPEPTDADGRPIVRRDKRGRRIDRRRVLVWISGPPKTEAEIDAMAQEARARA